MTRSITAALVVTLAPTLVVARHRMFHNRASWPSSVAFALIGIALVLIGIALIRGRLAWLNLWRFGADARVLVGCLAVAAGMGLLAMAWGMVR